MLKLENINAGYQNLQVLWDVSFEIKKGEFVTLIGTNGAGKTTTLRAISGILDIEKGSIKFLDKEISDIPPQKITEMGLSFVTEDGCLFNGMTVMENLSMGAYTISDKNKKKEILNNVFELFPRLAERKKQLAGTLSGGEQKMLAIARGLMSDPEIILIDEPSLGLAPQLVLSVFDTLRKLKETGVTILMVEQNVHMTLKITDRAYILEQGKIIMEGKSEELAKNEKIKESFLGM